MGQMIADIESERPDGFLDMVGALLDIPIDEREGFMEGVRARVAAAAGGGTIRDTSHLLRAEREDGTVHTESLVTVMVAPPGTSRARLARALSGYGMPKKYQARAERWLGVGHVVGQDSWVHVGTFLDEPWQYDGKLAHDAARLPPLRPLA